MRRLLVVALLASACSGGSEPIGNGHPAPTVEAAAASSTSIDVRWEAEDDAHRWWVILAAPDGRNVAQRTTCSECREVTVAHLAPSVEYAVRVVAVGAEGSFGEFPDPVTVSTPSEPVCESVSEADVCAVIQADAPIGDATGVGLGGLHGITTETDPAAVTALEPRAWRVSATDVERFNLARSYGGTVTVLLSDAWTSKVSSDPPWADWDAYEAFVAAVADAYIASGDLPDYWDVQNEPSPESFENGEPPTVELVLEQHRRAAAVIHQRLPGAAVIGPSANYVAFGSGPADVERFAPLAAGREGVLAGLSWHEIGAGCLGDCDGGPRALLQHVDDVRAALTDADASAELHVNEWGAPWNFLQPGAIVGYLTSIAVAGIDVANPTCWLLESASGGTESSCFVRPGTLAGRLLHDGRTRTDAWYAQRAYAQMTGPGFALLPGTVADPHASLVGSVDAEGVIRVLLGRHTGCDAEVDENCPPDVTYADDETIALVVGLANEGREYTATVERITSRSGASPGPERVDRSMVRVEGGRLQVGTWTVADGEAIVVTLSPTT